MSLTVDIRKKLGNFRLNVQFQSRSSRIGILGASGCGKSMTLKSIAGIETPDEGRILVNDRKMFESGTKCNIKPQKRNIGYLFQNYALFPTMTVEKNIAAGLKGSRAENQRQVQKMMEKFRISELAGRFPGELSGGQQQRVALARIMAYEPDVILLDEPFSALDVFLKDRLQQEMTDMLEEYPGIVILVSHSRDEIYRFSEELLIMDKGSVVTCGKTKEIFANPVYREAARLTGCKNFSVIRKRDSYTAEAADWGITLRVRNPIPEGAAFIGYRAHDFIPVWGERRKNCLKVRVESTAELPFEDQYYLLPEHEDSEGQTICWFVQRKMQETLKERGMPDYLELAEEKMLFLK